MMGLLSPKNTFQHSNHNRSDSPQHFFTMMHTPSRMTIATPQPPQPTAMDQSASLHAPVHFGTIRALSVTPAILTIIPDDGGAELTAYNLSQIQLETVLTELSHGSSHVSFALRQGPYGLYAEDVVATGYGVEARRGENRVERGDIFGGREGVGSGKGYVGLATVLIVVRD